MFTDIVGFSRRMGADEAPMLRLLAVHNQLIQHSGDSKEPRCYWPCMLGRSMMGCSEP